MQLTSFMARRYISSHGSHHFFSFISILTMAGIAIGTAAMIVVLSIINGFETELRNRFLAANAHIMMYQLPRGVKDSEKVEERVGEIFSPEVITGIAPFIHQEAMVQQGSQLLNVLVRGTDPKKRESVQPIGSYVSPETALSKISAEITAPSLSPRPGVIVGVGLAKKLGVELGESISVISPESEDLLGEFRSYRVVGWYNSGHAHYDDKLIILSLKAAQQLAHMPDSVTGLEIGLVEPWQDAEKVQSEIRKQFPAFIVKRWQEYNSSMFEAIRDERMLIALLVALVALVGGFNILTTLFVSVFQKERDISLLRALGCTKIEVMSIFVKQGFFMGLIGSSCGLILALVLSYVLEKYQIIALPEVYMLANLPVEYDPWVYGMTCVVSLIIATVAGILPSRASAQHDLSSSLKCRAP